MDSVSVGAMLVSGYYKGSFYKKYMKQERITIWLDKPLRKKLKEHVKQMRKVEPTASASGLVRQLLKECLK